MTGQCYREGPDDLHSGGLPASACAAPERAAAVGAAEPYYPGAMPYLRAGVLGPPGRALASRRAGNLHEAGGPQAPRDRRRDRAARAAARLAALTGAPLYTLWEGLPGTA